MEILTFALIASYNAHRQQERMVAEPEEFQPFDLQAPSKGTARRSTKRQSNSPARHVMEGGEAFYEIAEASADLVPKDRGPTPISLLHRLGGACRLICERYRQRQQLMEMDDRQLKDIGITREEAELEARKPVWKD